MFIAQSLKNLANDCLKNKIHTNILKNAETIPSLKKDHKGNKENLNKSQFKLRFSVIL